ncbi:MAG: hypothetical protein GX265_06475 [Mollicutes bacterium]|nr:hypothetical protein [Mollicutes bacterium]
MRYRYRNDDEMKDSGVEWLGRIPKEWGITKLKNHFEFEKGKNAALYTNDYIGLNEGDYPVYSGQTENNGVMGKINSYDYDLEKCIFTTTVGAKVMTPLLLKGKFNLSQNCLIMKGNNIFEEYIYYLLFPMFRYEKSLIPSYMQPSLRIDDLKKFYISYPYEKEQQKIALFLDKKTAEFDSIIEKKQSLITKLTEVKKSLISEVVTGKVKVLPPPSLPLAKGEETGGGWQVISRTDDEMKDSGVEWLGRIPKEWEVKRVRHIIKEPLKYGANESAELDDETLPRYIRITDFGDNGKLRNETFRSLEYKKAKEYFLENGDILFARSGATVGKTFQFKNYNGKACFAGYLIKASPNKEIIISDFMYSFTKTKNYENWKNSIFMQATIQNIGADKYKELKLCIPNSNEQQLIVDFLDEKTAKIDGTIEKIKLQIEKLKEAKQSLISEAVTGKIEVL